MPLPQEEYSPFFEGIGIDRPSSSVFRPGDVPAVQRATGLILKDIGQVLKLNDDAVRDVRCSGLMKANKDKLCEWLEIFVCLAENYTDPLLSAACKVDDIAQKLKSEKIRDQMTIIGLQQKVIEKQDKQLAKVQETVKSGMQSYANVVEKSCSELVLSETKITAAVKSAVQAENRSCNLIIYGAEEVSNEDVEGKVGEILSHLREKPHVVQCSRIGTAKAGCRRPIKVVLRGSDHVKQILRKAEDLKDIDACRNVFVCPDRSVDERLEIRKKVEERKKQRTEAAQIT